ncbi:uncharacterized protein [Choristoneura fumiferana]|uniref:uncharacterized protein n=1 Tax=Choristoneura fumiferana TaxID=7141 RepID=UPI003D15BFB1
MAGASSLSSSLLAFACFALLQGACDARRKKNVHNHEHFDHHVFANCAGYSRGKVTRDVVLLKPIDTPPYDTPYNIMNIDHCKQKGKKLVGFLMQACDPLGPPGPSITVYSKLKQKVKCYTDGPCPSGLTVKVSQYCSKH